MTYGDSVVIAPRKDLGVFRFVGRAITFEKGKAELVCVIEAIEGQELNGEKIDEVCIKENLLEHHEGQEHERD